MPRFPNRWFDYSNMGKVIDGTRIITFKVPLKENFFAHNKKNEEFRFTPATLLDNINERGLKLGLVIDLTFTKRYYDGNEFTDNGILYKKIFVEGHVIPNQEVINEFYEEIDKFIATSEEDKLIGVHCTHGVNRTGYVVCRYMVEHLGLKATDSLEAYHKARGYPVERMNYINDLKRRAGEPVSREDEEKEEKEKNEEPRNSWKQVKKEKSRNHEDKADGRSDRSEWRNEENPSSRSSDIPRDIRREDHCRQNDQRWDRNYGHHHHDRLDGRHFENYDYQDDGYNGERFHENSYRDQYGSGSGNWNSQNGQHYDQAVIAEYDLDPDVWYGYQRPSHPQYNHGYNDGAFYNNSRGPPNSPYLNNFNQYWGSGANQGTNYGNWSHAQHEGNSDSNWGNNSHGWRSSSKQNSYSGKQGRANKGNDRMKPF